MFNDPIAAEYATVAVTLPRVSLKEGSAVYRSPNGEQTLTISHNTAKNRTRFLVRLDENHDADVIALARNARTRFSAYIVMDMPSKAAYSYTEAAAKATVVDLINFLTLIEGGVVDRVLGHEV